jgi:MtN3 and saliva related transmembrane protein
VTALGFIAGTMTTLSFLPQVIRSYRARSAASFSWGWLVLFAGGVGAWLCYGVFRSDPALVLTNAVTLLLVVTLIMLRIRERGDQEDPAAHPASNAGDPAVSGEIVRVREARFDTAGRAPGL